MGVVIDVESMVGFVVGPRATDAKFGGGEEKEKIHKMVSLVMLKHAAKKGLNHRSGTLALTQQNVCV